MIWLVNIAHEAVDKPLCLDSPNSAALLAGLSVTKQPPMINSISGELFGLRWKCFDPVVPSITIMETTYKGKIRPWRKTRGSLTTTPIATELAAELVEWKKPSKYPSPEAFIFPNRAGGFLDSSNFRNRVLHKLAEELELPKLTFQVIRRTIATLAQ